MGMVDPTLRTALLAMAELVMAREPDEVIYRGSQPYMQRWHLVRKAAGDVENVYIHRFIADDAEVPHDHPWDSRSIVLSGQYLECWQRTDTSATAYTTRFPGEIIDRPATHIHAICGVEPGTTTLFITGPKLRDWGFFTSEGFVPWRQYHGLPHDAQAPA